MNARSRAAAYTRSLRAGSLGGGVPRPRKSARSRPRKRASRRHQVTSDSDSSGVQPAATRSFCSAASVTRSRGGSVLSIARRFVLTPREVPWRSSPPPVARSHLRKQRVTTSPPDRSSRGLRGVAAEPSRLPACPGERMPGVKQRVRGCPIWARLSDSGRCLRSLVHRLPLRKTGSAGDQQGPGPPVFRVQPQLTHQRNSGREWTARSGTGKSPCPLQARVTVHDRPFAGRGVLAELASRFGRRRCAAPYQMGA
jgi:hypothetical protein